MKKDKTFVFLICMLIIWAVIFFCAFLVPLKETVIQAMLTIGSSTLLMIFLATIGIITKLDEILEAVRKNEKEKSEG